MKRFSAFIFLFSVLAWYVSVAENVSNLSSALDLDGQTGITLVSFQKIVYSVKQDSTTKAYEYEKDSSGNIKIKKNESNAGWKVQSGTQYKTSPLQGKSCVVSDLPTGLNEGSDNQEARLVFKVSGSGVFSFFYKTSCDDSDYLTVYVDGGEQFSTSGYDEFGDDDYDWNLSGDSIPGCYYDIEIIGPNESGKFEHEVVFVFEKDLPDVDSETGKYVPDGPEKDDDDYNDKKSRFFNRVWLDYIRWTLTPLEFYLDDHPDPYTDEALITPNTNAGELGYVVKYTLDGSEPTPQSMTYDTSGTISVSHSCTLKITVFTGDLAPTGIGVFTQNIVIKLSEPGIKEDTAASGNGEMVLELTKSKTGGDNVIVYTLDGSEPTETSEVYNAIKKLHLTSGCTLKARCVRDGCTPSDVVSRTIEKMPSPIYRLERENGSVEPYGVTTDDKLYLVVEPSGATTKYGTSADAMTNIYQDGVRVPISAGGKLFLYNVKEGNIPSDIVCVEVKRANEVIFGATNNHPLEAGWNLVSFPLTLTQDSITALLINRWNWIVFEFDSTIKAYCKPTTIVPGKGYWIFNFHKNNPFGVTLYGVRPDAIGPLTEGWNLAGVIENQMVLNGKSAWGYEDGKFVPLSGAPSLWKGYMVFFTE